MKATGNEKFAPDFKLPVGRLEFWAWNKKLAMDRPTILVIAMFVVQLIINVLEFRIPTDPKSKGEEKVSGRARAVGDT
jgi:hypothetical protein